MNGTKAEMALRITNLELQVKAQARTIAGLRAHNTKLKGRLDDRAAIAEAAVEAATAAPAPVQAPREAARAAHAASHARRG
jgi:cell division protein FtsB